MQKGANARLQRYAEHCGQGRTVRALRGESSTGLAFNAERMQKIGRITLNAPVLRFLRELLFKFYGIDTDPQQLNWFLPSVGGFTERGWLYWDRAVWWAPDRVRHVYEDLPSYWLIDSNLARGNPVIVRVRLQSGITHFVVVAGKQGFDYLVRDPGAGAAKGFYPLRELNSKIEALRFYQPLTQTQSHLSAAR